MSMFRPSSQFDKLLDKATSNLRLEPDWPAIMQICDLIRQGDVQPKAVLAGIKKKLANSNPHVAMFALLVLESCVKNCGSLIHEEIGTRAYMEQLREYLKACPHENVRNKLLELLQAWAYAFRNSPKYRAVQDTVNIMKAEGYKFPALKESDAMFSADTAPEWVDGTCCHRCRAEFGIMNRKHHCRACGQVFCSQCTSKSCTLPKFGIEREVRVCEACFDKFNKPAPAGSTSKSSSGSEDLPIEYLTSSLAQQSQAPPPRKSEDELREEEELQLAIALSQSEAEHKTKQTLKSSPIAAAPRKTYSPPPVVNNSPDDPELARYLNRSNWQKQTVENNSPSAPSSVVHNNKMNNIDEDQKKAESEMDDFVFKLKGQVEIFVNRMKSNSSRGRSIANDSSVQTLFMNITAMHSRLLWYIQQQDDKRVYFEGLQDKLTQVRDARAALDALREEHREKLRREAEFAERQRQLQMAQKLDIMRKKKQEYLQYQRQLALQAIQEQERELQMRQEMQKQLNLRGTYPGMPPPVPYPPMQPYDHGRYPPPHSGMYGQYQPGAPMAPVMGTGPEYMGPPPGGMAGPPPHMMGPAPHMPGPYVGVPQAMGPQSLPGAPAGGPMRMPGQPMSLPQPGMPGQPMMAGAPPQPGMPPQAPMAGPQPPTPQPGPPPQMAMAPPMMPGMLPPQGYHHLPPQAPPQHMPTMPGAPDPNHPQAPPAPSAAPPHNPHEPQDKTGELISFD